MTKFVAFEKVSEFAYTNLFDKAKTSDTMQTTINLGSGLIAGFAAATVSQPVDTMLSKINKTKGLPGRARSADSSRLLRSSASVVLSAVLVLVCSWLAL
jgi:solute carrier family 25 (mitochondrial phosphate transporter), member 3